VCVVTCHFYDQDARFSESPLTSYRLSTNMRICCDLLTWKRRTFEILIITRYLTLNNIVRRGLPRCPLYEEVQTRPTTILPTLPPACPLEHKDLFIFVLLIVLILSDDFFLLIQRNFPCCLLSAFESYRIANGRMHLCTRSLLSIGESVLLKTHYRSIQHYM
jgi:hypothetical protein